MQGKEQKYAKRERISVRAILTGLVLLILNAYWVALSSEVWFATQLTIASLFFNALFTLFVLVLLNLLLKRYLPRYSFSQSELLFIYTMVVMISTISGHPMMGYLIPVLEHPFWFATPENEWAELFHPYIPRWYSVQDRQVLSGYFNGESSLYTAEHLRAWLPPVLAWSFFVIVLWHVLMWTTVLIRKQWIEHEKLSYPIVQLPVAMTENPTSFFRNKLLWLGFGIVAVIDILNGLHFLYPQVPAIPVKNQYIGSFSSRPWNAMGGVTISFYPFIIGLMFFTPLDLSFSCWFFYVIRRLQSVLASAVGLQGSYTHEQSIGAWVALGLLALWMGRRHYARICRRIFGGKELLDTSGEPISYRTAALRIGLGMAFLALFLMQAGMSLWVIGLFFLIYFPMVFGITRARAEIGPPLHTVIYVDPGRTLVTFLGTRRLGPANLTNITFLYPFNRCYRAHPMPSQLEAFKIASRTGISSRQQLWGMSLAIIVGIFVTFWIYLDMFYRLGASAKARGWVVYMGWETFNRLQSWLTYPREPDIAAVTGIGLGFLFTLFLMVMKLRFIWWPFHPAGYALTAGSGLGRSWFAVFISWFLKWLILKYGGARAYRKAVPFFFGLILGDYTLGCIWSLIGLVLRTSTYGVWH